MQEWLKARAEGADEGNKGLLSAARIENRVFVAIVVVMFAGIPFIDVDLNTIQYDSSRSAQCQVSVPQPTDTGWSQSFSTINNQSAKVPVWWAFMHALSRAVTSASVAAIPCGTDLRQCAWRSTPRALTIPCWPRKWRISRGTATGLHGPRVVVLLAAAVGANVAGIYLVGSVAGWERWLAAAAGYFLVWRLCLYGATAYGWVWMRRRLLAREDDAQARRRLVRSEIAGAVAIVALEASLLMQG